MCVQNRARRVGPKRGKSIGTAEGTRNSQDSDAREDSSDRSPSIDRSVARIQREAKDVAPETRARLCIRVRSVLDEEGRAAPAIYGDAAAGRLWAIGSDAQQGSSNAVRARAQPGSMDAQQFSCDTLIESGGSQADLYDALGAPLVDTVRAGGNGCVLCYGAIGSGRRHSMRSETDGQKGLVPQIVSALLQGDGSDAAGIRMASLILSKDSHLYDTNAGKSITQAGKVGGGGAAVLQHASWEAVRSEQDASRLLQGADATLAQLNPRSSHQIVLMQVNGRSLLGLVTLASVDTVDTAPEQGAESAVAQLAALEACLQAMSLHQTPPFERSLLTTILSPFLSGGDPSARCLTSLLLCLHPSEAKLPMSREALRFSQACGVRHEPEAEVDFAALAARLMAVRDARRDALFKLEWQVLVELRPQLEEVMQLEERHAALTSQQEQLAREGGGAAARARLERPVLDESRHELAARVQKLRTERNAVAEELRQELNRRQGSNKPPVDRRSYTEESEALTAQISALQAELEGAEKSVSSDSSAARNAVQVIPGVARDLGVLAMSFAQNQLQSEAAELFSSALVLLEASFGAEHPDIAAFKDQVTKVLSTSAGDTAASGASTLRVPALQLQERLGGLETVQ
mmetsp:Transcript_13750/g.28988  ORF Transcript_13750/g.28988 Transcript_13750/m.28988 type:complete len:633 (-) Transcript_13750:5-1903(-)